MKLACIEMLLIHENKNTEISIRFLLQIAVLYRKQFSFTQHENMITHNSLDKLFIYRIFFVRIEISIGDEYLFVELFVRK